MLPQFTKRQLKEAKYQQDQKAMQELAKDDPDAIIVYLPKEEAIISSEYGDDLEYGFKTAQQFINWRLNDCLKGNLNALADEMGYDTVSSNHQDFLVDNREYHDNLEQFVLDSYSSQRIGNLYDD
ncbi:hypothetical protein EFM11_02470 [Lactobacillus helveticus]|nr:hypothetical protein [Lactobacillus helveticus]MCT0164419.1 hypothetical protein [Lactobacillus helveticus]